MLFRSAGPRLRRVGVNSRRRHSQWCKSRFQHQHTVCQTMTTMCTGFANAPHAGRASGSSIPPTAQTPRRASDEADIVVRLSAGSWGLRPGLPTPDVLYVCPRDTGKFRAVPQTPRTSRAFDDARQRSQRVRLLLSDSERASILQIDGPKQACGAFQ